MTPARFTCLLISIAAGQWATAQSTEPKQGPSRPWGADPPKGPQEAQTWNMTGVRTGGIVEAVTKESITLHWPAREKPFPHFDLETGKRIGTDKKLVPAIPGKKFVLGDDLARGGYLKGAPSEETYRSTDVAVGDLVAIVYDRRNGIDICTTICIERRVGGVIPPAPGEKPDAFRKHHEAVSAAQNWEERRIPYPPKYAPTYRTQDGKIVLTPIPIEFVEEELVPSLIVVCLYLTR